MKVSRASWRFPLTAVLAALLLAVVGQAARAAEELWLTDFEAAKAKAKAEKKYLLVDFTGSDWCGWCIKLRKEVFDEKLFKEEAPKDFVLVELDFPQQKELPEKVREQNKKLQEQYKVQGFPTILMMDAEGKVIAKTGYRPDGPEKYIAHLADFRKAHGEILALIAKLDSVKGIDRAKLLDNIIGNYEKLDNAPDEVAAWSKEIISLDPDNKAGLKVKYEFRELLAEANKLKGQGKFDDAMSALEKAIAMKGISAEQKQDAYLAQGECYFRQQKFRELVACLKKGLEAAPEGPKAEQFKGMIARFGKIAEQLEAIDKIEGKLADAKGLDKAKLLDELLEIREKARFMVPDDGKTKERIEEILALDPENKAGLKAKYRIKAIVSEATGLARKGQGEEAAKVIDKALEDKNLSAEETQQLLLTKAGMYGRDREKLVETLKKALEAAPEGKLAPQIKAMISYMEKAPKTPATKPAAKKPAKKAAPDKD